MLKTLAKFNTYILLFLAFGHILKLEHQFFLAMVVFQYSNTPNDKFFLNDYSQYHKMKT